MTRSRSPMPRLKRLGGYWTCLYYGRDGVRRQKRLGSIKKVARAEAEDRYAEILEAWRRGKLDTGLGPGEEVTIRQFVAAYTKHAKGYYITPDGESTGEALNMVDALRPLDELYGSLPLSHLRPRHIKGVQDAMVEAKLARKTINDRIKRIRRALKWAVVSDMVEPAILEGIRAVEPLRRGRTVARETQGVKPAAIKDVAATMRAVSPTVRTMIGVQYRTGMRPQEVCNMRWADIDQAGDIWLYTPFKHKTQWKDKSRVIAVGPRAQRLLMRYANVAAEAFIFSPKRALKELHAERPTHRRKPNLKRKTDRRVTDSYTTESYRQAIQDACEKIGANGWSPNRLRHALATRVRREFGLEFSQAVLGHSKIETTQIYAQQGMTRAIEVMQKIG